MNKSINHKDTKAQSQFSVWASFPFSLCLCVLVVNSFSPRLEGYERVQ